jgi:NADH-quinone oxidoreductase subunit D
MRSPSFSNLQILPMVLTGYRVSDAIAIIGSIDIILGCVDR